MVLSDSMMLRLVVPKTSRSTAYASFDGKGRVELRRGDEVRVEAGRYPFPTVVGEGGEEWFESVRRALRWNTRGVVQGGWGGRLAGEEEGFIGAGAGGLGYGERIGVGGGVGGNMMMEKLVLEEAQEYGNSKNELGQDEEDGEEEEEEWDIDADPIEVGDVDTVTGTDSGNGESVSSAGGGGSGETGRSSPTKKATTATIAPPAVPAPASTFSNSGPEGSGLD